MKDNKRYIDDEEFRRLHREPCIHCNNLVFVSLFNLTLDAGEDIGPEFAMCQTCYEKELVSRVSKSKQ